MPPHLPLPSRLTVPIYDSISAQVDSLSADHVINSLKKYTFSFLWDLIALAACIYNKVCIMVSKVQILLTRHYIHTYMQTLFDEKRFFYDYLGDFSQASKQITFRDQLFHSCGLYISLCTVRGNRILIDIVNDRALVPS